MSVTQTITEVLKQGAVILSPPVYKGYFFNLSPLFTPLPPSILHKTRA